MARFRVGGDEDGNDERPSNKNNRRLPKKPRTSSDPTVGSAAAAAATGNPRSVSAAPQIPSVRESRPEKRKSSKRTYCSDSSEDEDDDDDDAEEEREQQTVGCGDGVQPTEARANSTPNGNCMGTESVGCRVDAPPPGNCMGTESVGCRVDAPPPAPISVTLTDPDVLDCPICLDPLKLPVYQCENGHVACESCCIKMENKCASCSWPIGYNRCRAIEKVLESVRISCPNTQYGCKESLNYSKKLDHEKTCNYAPCSCPHPDCTYIGLPNSVYSHFATQHPNSSDLFLFNYDFSVPLGNNQKHVFLQETVEDTLFILNRSIEHRGSCVNVVCVAPISSTRKFLYEVTATNGVSYVKLKTVAEMTPHWTGQPPDKKYLLVPNDFMASGGQLQLEVTLRRDRGLRLSQTRK